MEEWGERQDKWAEVAIMKVVGVRWPDVLLER